MKLQEVFAAAGLPEGVFQVVQGQAQTGRLLTRHRDIRKISLTGEVGTGKAVMADAAATLKQVTLELGGKSPLIVFGDAKLDNAVAGALLAISTRRERCVRTARACSCIRACAPPSWSACARAPPRCASGIRWILLPRWSADFRGAHGEGAGVHRPRSAQGARLLTGGARVTSGIWRMATSSRHGVRRLP